MSEELTKQQITAMRQQYGTPPHVAKQVLQIYSDRYGIDEWGLDVAADKHNKQARRYLCAPNNYVGDRDCVGVDGLLEGWYLPRQHAAAWCNPPFGMFKQFMWVAYHQAREFRLASAVLTINDPSTEYYQFGNQRATAKIVIPERLSFIPPPRLLAHLEREGKPLPGNSKTHVVWLFKPGMLDPPSKALSIEPAKHREWKVAPK